MLVYIKRILKASDELAVGSAGNTGFFARAIEGKVKRIRVVNPVQFKVISNSVKKTDENDAQTIARFLSRDLIPELRMRDKESSRLGH